MEQGANPDDRSSLPALASTAPYVDRTKGGRVKPSTGYAFWRTQKDSNAIVISLLGHRDPTHIPADKHRAKIFDSIMLAVMEKHGGRMAVIFPDMFKNNPIHRIFRFLDEESSLLDELGIISSVPTGPFLKALLRTGIRPGK